MAPRPPARAPSHPAPRRTGPGAPSTGRCACRRACPKTTAPRRRRPRWRRLASGLWRPRPASCSRRWPRCAALSASRSPGCAAAVGSGMRVPSCQGGAQGGPCLAGSAATCTVPALPRLGPPSPARPAPLPATLPSLAACRARLRPGACVPAPSSPLWWNARPTAPCASTCASPERRPPGPVHHARPASRLHRPRPRTRRAQRSPGLGLLCVCPLAPPLSALSCCCLACTGACASRSLDRLAQQHAKRSR